jgi:hypothetical protein
MSGTIKNHKRNEHFVKYFGYGNPNGRYYMEDAGMDERTILKWILSKYNER